MRVEPGVSRSRSALLRAGNANKRNILHVFIDAPCNILHDGRVMKTQYTPLKFTDKEIESLRQVANEWTWWPWMRRPS